MRWIALCVLSMLLLGCTSTIKTTEAHIHVSCYTPLPLRVNVDLIREYK